MERKLFEELAKSVKQAGAIVRGERKPARKYVYSASRVQAVREKAELSQAQFARLLNVSVRTLQNWEQDRREPTGPAKALLRIVEKEPALALRALMQSDAA
jgi:putative transcriptional regulator